MGASGDVAMTARGRASSGVATGRRGTRPGYKSGRQDGRVQRAGLGGRTEAPQLLKWEGTGSRPPGDWGGG